MIYLLILIRIAVGGVFLYSGWSKLMAPVENFEAVLETYQFFSSSFISIISHVVPWIEFIFGAFMVLGFMTRYTAIAVSGMLSTFIFLLVRSLFLKIPLAECGCFGAGISLSPTQALALDVILLCSSIILVLKGKLLPYSLDQWLNKTR